MALPTGGPWHKLELAIDQAKAIKSRQIIATHNGLYNEHGQSVANRFIAMNLGDETREVIYLNIGESLE